MDDGSTDGTFEILDEFSQEEKFVKALSFSKNFGHQAALSAGLRIAEGDAVISLDADLQDPPELIENILICYRDGFEIVYGVRNNREEDTFFKRISATGVCLRFGLLCSEHSYPRLLPVFPEPKQAFFCFRLQKSAQPNPHPPPVLPAAKSKVP